LQARKNYQRGMIKDMDGMKLRNHTMVAFLQHFFHAMRADDFRGALLEISKGIGVSLLGEAHT
jgi:hypothetical protein